MAVKDVSRFGMQRKIVANMTSQSWHDIPHVSYQYDPDVTTFFEKYKIFNATLPEDRKVSFNTVMIKTIAEALKASPQMNAHLHFEPGLVRGKITQYDNIDVSMPWILPDGKMMTITMKDIGNRSLGNITDYITATGKKIEKTNLTEAMYSVSVNDSLEELKKGKIVKVLGRLIGANTGNHKIPHLRGDEKKAYEAIPEDERLTKADLQQGTITISNVGATSRSHAGELALLMIIPPQVCAIGVGALQRRPIVKTNDKGEEVITPASILPLNICFDHRALDFGEIRPFLDRLKELFENPEEIFVY